MGRVIALFSVGTVQHAFFGVEFNELYQIISSLPGSTRLIGTHIDYGTGVFTVILDNAFFVDDTKLVGRYKRHTQVQAIGTQVVAIFDGVDIIDPNTNNQVSINTASTSPQTISVPPNFTGTVAFNPSTSSGTTNPSVSGTSPQSTFFAYPYNNPPIDLGPITLDPPPSFSPVCNCGAAKIGSNCHSSWCDVSTTP